MSTDSTIPSVLAPATVPAPLDLARESARESSGDQERSEWTRARLLVAVVLVVAVVVISRFVGL